jgi:hypothetical protein
MHGDELGGMLKGIDGGHAGHDGHGGHDKPEGNE